VAAALFILGWQLCPLRCVNSTNSADICLWQAIYDSQEDA
jgi:hypothetical protein